MYFRACFRLCNVNIIVFFSFFSYTDGFWKNELYDDGLGLEQNQACGFDRSGFVLYPRLNVKYFLLFYIYFMISFFGA